MSDGTFEKVGMTEERMFGPRKILVIGFPPEDQTRLRALLAEIGLTDIPAVFAATSQGATRVGELLELPDGAGQGQESALPRAVILSGLTQKELHTVLQQYPAAGLPVPLWATLTDTSAGWPLSDLLKELAAEREFFQRQQQQQQ